MRAFSLWGGFPETFVIGFVQYNSNFPPDLVDEVELERPLGDDLGVAVVHQAALDTRRRQLALAKTLQAKKKCSVAEFTP